MQDYLTYGATCDKTLTDWSPETTAVLLLATWNVSCDMLQRQPADQLLIVFVNKTDNYTCYKLLRSTTLLWSLLAAYHAQDAQHVIDQQL